MLARYRARVRILGRPSLKTYARHPRLIHIRITSLTFQKSLKKMMRKGRVTRASKRIEILRDTAKVNSFVFLRCVTKNNITLNQKMIHIEVSFARAKGISSILLKRLTFQIKKFCTKMTQLKTRERVCHLLKKASYMSRSSSQNHVIPSKTIVLSQKLAK